jgi:hypothetical protein
LLDGTLEGGFDVLLLRDSDGVVWILDLPDEYSIEAGPPVVLLGPLGEPVAKVGDLVGVGGGPGAAAGTWNACGGISLQTP